MSADQYSEILRRLERLDETFKGAIYGTPETKHVGLFVRVDRLEQSEVRRRWALRTLVGAVATLVARTVYSVFVK